MPARERDLNRLFDRIEKAFSIVVEGRGTNTEGEGLKYTTERFKDDAADIIFRWEGRDFVQRSIHPYLATSDMYPCSLPLGMRIGQLWLPIEVSAWKDIERPELKLERHYHHSIVIVTTSPFRQSNLVTSLNYALSVISGWREEDLDLSAPLKYPLSR